MLREYITNNKPDLEFVNNFFNINYNSEEKDKFYNFFETHKLFSKTKNKANISRILNIPETTIDHWLKFRSIPFLVKLYNYNSELNKSKNKWLSLNSSRGGLFTGPWVSVPLKINDIDDIKKVINQIKPLDNYNILSDEYKTNDKLFLFFYLLGMTVGDTSKTPIKRKNRTMRRLQLRLTKRYLSCERVGEFTTLCLNSIGLRMNRGKDCPKSKKTEYDFYAWHSQCSLLIEWIFTVVLGMKSNELTTYDKIKCDWLLNIDKKFKVAFLQGLSDSDGYVDITTRRAGIITGPNTDFVMRLFKSMNIKSTKTYFHNGTLGCVNIAINDAYSLPLFNENVRLYRYELMEKVVKAKRLPRPFPEWLSKRINYLISKNYSSTKIIHKILNDYNIIISQGGLKKRVDKMKLLTLGIESTAL